MKKYKVGILALAALGLSSTGVSATTINLFEYAFNFDGTVTNGSAPAGVNLAGFDTTTGLGTISFSTSVDGAHSFLAFFDHEIDQLINTFFNEYGDTSGSPAAGQSWEIDEPGWATPPDYVGNIYFNFENTTLDDSNGVQAGYENDVSMAMGWDFILAADETATITLTLSQSQPLSGFYLTQLDPDSPTGALPANIYFSSNLTIGGGGIVPEPGAMLLMATGLTGLLGTCVRRKMKK